MFKINSWHSSLSRLSRAISGFNFPLRYASFLAPFPALDGGMSSWRIPEISIYSTRAVVQWASSSRRQMVGVFGMQFVLNHSGGALLRLFHPTTVTYFCSHQHFVCDLSMDRRCIKQCSVLPGVRLGRNHDEHSESGSTMDWKMFIGAGD